MADDHDHQVGGEVVGALMVQFLAADVAAVGDLQEGAEHAAPAAVRAAAGKAAPQRGLERHDVIRLGLGFGSKGEEIHGS